MKKQIALLAALTMILAACEKEIAMNYIPVDPIYVIEGHVSDTNMEVLLTTTRDMDDGGGVSPVPGAEVTISDDEGRIEVLAYAGNGLYSSNFRSKGTPGKIYTLSVSVDGKEFVSTSEISEPGQMTEIDILFDPSLTERWMFCTATIQDIAPGDTRYCLRVFKNEDLYSRRLITDESFDGKELQDRFAFRFSSSPVPTPEEIESGNAEKMFRKGDRLTLVLQTIDRPVYDYLYSLGLTSATLSNPLTNIEGGCLGYFNAFSSDSYSMIFDPDAIKEQMPSLE